MSGVGKTTGPLEPESRQQSSDIQKTGKGLGHLFSIKSVTGKLRSIFDTVQVDNQPYSAKELSRETGFSTREIKFLAKSGELAEILSTKTLTVAGKTVTLPELADEIGITVKGVYALQQDIEGAGFSIEQLSELQKGGLLSPELLKEAKQLKEMASHTKAAGQEVTQAFIRDLMPEVSKPDDASKHIEEKVKFDATKQYKPEDYARAYKAMEHLAERPQSTPAEHLRAVKTDEQLSLLDVSQEEKLGKGSFGTAKKVHDIADKKEIVVKSPNIEISEKDKKLIQRGTEILAKLHGKESAIPGIIAKTQVSKATSETLGALYTRGELSEKVASKFTRVQARAMVMDTLFGLSKAHEKGIFHRDIKPPNMLVDAKGMVGLADWDGAVDFGDRDDPHSLGLLGISTRAYSISSEILQLQTMEYLWKKQSLSGEERRETQLLLAKMDGLATGLSYIEAITGMLPYDHNGANPQALLEDPSVWVKLKEKGLTNNQINGIKWMIHPDIEKRKTPTEVLNALSGTSQKLPPFPIKPTPAIKAASEITVPKAFHAARQRLAAIMGKQGVSKEKQEFAKSLMDNYVTTYYLNYGYTEQECLENIFRLMRGVESYTLPDPRDPDIVAELKQNGFSDTHIQVLQVMADPAMDSLSKNAKVRQLLR